MKVRVLGCSGAIAKGCRTTSFLIDGDILVDAGTGVGDLSLAEMRSITDVLLTHSHLDHVAALPLMLDAIGSQLSAPVRVHALPGTINALRSHLFNNVLWPDFTRIPAADKPFLIFQEIHIGQVLEIAGRRIEVLPAVHTVPAAGYAVSAGRGCWVFTGDTGPNRALWDRLNKMDVSALVIETAFSNREKDLARVSRHHAPLTLADELIHIAPGRRYPIYITHTKPAETEMIMAEIRCSEESGKDHDIRWLSAGQEFEI